MITTESENKLWNNWLSKNTCVQQLLLQIVYRGVDLHNNENTVVNKKKYVSYVNLFDWI